MRSEISLAVENINTLKDTVNKIQPGTLVFPSEDLYPKWDVTGPAPDDALKEFTTAELETRIEKCLKQKETPAYSGEDSDDIEVFALNMISWYAAYGLYFKNPQVDLRVAQLMMNHTRGKAKTWYLCGFKGTKTWTAILVASFFDCKQGTRSLDVYMEEFVRLGNTDDVSEQYKMVLFKKGLKSTKLRELLQVREFDSLDDLLDGARGLNPKDADTGPARINAKPAKKPRCSSTRCLETGHTADTCWALHPDLKPQWLLNREKAGYNSMAAPAPPIQLPSTTDTKLWEVLTAIQTDLQFKLTGPTDGILGPDEANDNLDSWVFDPGKTNNAKYFVENTQVATDWSRNLIKEVGCVCNGELLTRGSAFFDEGADFCGVSEEFLRKNELIDFVVDKGTFEVTFGNGKTESIPNRTISLSIFVDEMSSFDFEFNVCLIPNGCDLMMGVPWKRKMQPIID
ncbi:hypothetical protein PHYSODRAFT_499074 [Phytophthora sojae]|uniref:Retrotransposon gag domain-containing protein n=1 Tax=Phytophthora sojae (strain P6497) TaxID=1094619 RepID=G4ZJM2_PHYSP|nr:hypothetical protein PHYSODRAFT_499074 [Phytophthora sojae]EGZ18242.1 hypothetical protein PHYSODRAFT_499074 [Phytophthora sojae]|eukprot:XP_009527300.1 hypothetical protein PHYSODRAFT_499074 [Phytophthora sojae]